jgi:hypothetical protein
MVVLQWLQRAAVRAATRGAQREVAERVLGRGRGQRTVATTARPEPTGVHRCGKLAVEIKRVGRYRITRRRRS